jgi:hypothetical protein
MPMTERTVRIDLIGLQDILREHGDIQPDEYVNDAHVEPNELVIRVLKEKEVVNG